MQKRGFSCHVLVDFDGTLVPSDATDSLLERFAAPEWRDVEALWQSGKIGSRECLSRQVSLLRATPDELDEAINDIGIDPSFRSFMNLCTDYGITASVVSDGFDRVIGRVLYNHGIVMRYTANRLEPVGEDRWTVSFPHVAERCRMLAGHCKCATADRESRGIKVVIGDGRSDFCVAGGADLVFAKGNLATHCESEAITHTPIKSFADVTQSLSAWLRTRLFATRDDWHNGASSYVRLASSNSAARATSTES